MTVPARMPTVLIPVVEHVDVRALAEIAASLGGEEPPEITIVAVVEVPLDRDLSSGARAARNARIRLEELAHGLSVKVHPVVRTDRSIPAGVVAAATEFRPDLILAGWSSAGPGSHRSQDAVERIIAAVAEAHAAHIGVVRLGSAPRPGRVLVAVRGGPNAEFALASASLLASRWRLPLAVLHVMPPWLTREAREQAEQSLLAMAREHASGEVDRVVVEGDDVVAAIRDASRHDDLLLLGAAFGGSAGGADPGVAAQLDAGATLLGDVPARLMREASGSVMVVRTREAVPPAMFEELAARSGTLPALDHATEQLRAVPERVERWFAESNYHHAEFGDLRRLVDLKDQQGLTVSLVLPTLNEEATIGDIVRRAREHLMERHALVDELLVIDSASTDRTREIAAAEGARVVRHQDVLRQYGSVSGKGEALWKSLYETTGDLVAWADTDVRDWDPRMVYGTLGPLLIEPRIQYVKGYYQRPIVEDGVLKEGGGGRVTELVARPMINLLYPELSGFIQPLAGEYAGRRTILEQIPFFTGYAVEIGHLIDIYERVGLGGFGQVDLERRVHRNQEIEGLSKMSFVILQAVLKRLESGRRAHLLAELGSRMKLPRSGPGELLLEVIELGDAERPPIVQIPEYLGRVVGDSQGGAPH